MIENVYINAIELKCLHGNGFYSCNNWPAFVTKCKLRINKEFLHHYTVFLLKPFITGF